MESVKALAEKVTGSAPAGATPAAVSIDKMPSIEPLADSVVAHRGQGGTRRVRQAR